MTKPYQFQPKSIPGLGPSGPALALATKLTWNDFSDVYKLAGMIDVAFAHAIEETRQEERARIFKMGVWELLREYWKGKKVYSK